MITAVAVFGARSFAQAPQTPPQKQRLTKEDGVMAMRMLLTMQANTPYGAKTGYGTLSEIVRLMPTVHVAPAIESDDVTLIDERTASYRGYTIRLSLSPDRKRFEIALVPQGGACATSWFSNEQNVIYTGQALGCPTQ